MPPGAARPSSIGLAICVAMATLSCVAPAASPADPGVREVQATAVRRTEVADVQRIIAGNLLGTPTPQPTATLAPTCGSALWWYEARDHVGESRVVQGPVVRSRPGPSGSVWLEMGQPFPDPTGLPVLVLASAATDLAGKTICVDGRIATIDGTPTIDARGAARIVVVN